jgi:transposase
MERRRLAAARLMKDGFTQAQVAREFGVSRMTACRWAKALENGESLERRRKKA